MVKIIVANVFGLVSAVAFWYSNFKKSKKQMLRVHLICNISDCLQYIILGAHTAVANSFVTLLKNLAFLKLSKQRQLFGVALFGLTKIILMLCVYDNALTLAMVVYEVVSVAVLLRGKTKYMLYLGIINAVIWMLYDFVCMAYIASLLGVFSIVSQVVAVNKNKGCLDGTI